MENEKISANADSGCSTITSFRYFDGLCFVTLANKVSGIIGDSTACSLATMLSLKGQGIKVMYQATGAKWTDRLGNEHPRYRLEWSLE